VIAVLLRFPWVAPLIRDRVLLESGAATTQMIYARVCSAYLWETIVPAVVTERPSWEATMRFLVTMGLETQGRPIGFFGVSTNMACSDMACTIEAYQCGFVTT
jgi:hypothetical protein